ncbi:hypothetical protein Fmac_024495 [Flemingia macrophylla]|uniref:DDE Tnp4 domain-containing protein n=1 Tax=Flemingia macrophylla TaxID=520843 RepID=A0ABD1LPJ6_9FABA
MEGENIDVFDLDNEDRLDANLIAQIQSQVKMRTQVGAMTIICLVAFGLNMLSSVRCTSSNIRDFVSQKERRRHELMLYLIHTEQCRDIICMGPVAFINLCERVRATGLVKDVFRSTVEEQVAKFLHNVGHNVKNRSVYFFFHRSGETVSRHFHNVLNAIIMLEGQLLVQPSGRDVQPYILNNSRFYPYFKGQIITPFQGVRYHLKEYSRRGPQNPRELFNHLHSSLRNVIERTFGVLKKIFPIIASGTEPHYSLDTMTNIVLACCILHNFLRGFDNDESLLAEVDRELMEEDVDTMSTQVREEDYREGSNLRDFIANEMWRDYQNN